MVMRNLILSILFSIFLVCHINAQEVSPEVVASAGSFSICWTLGELAIETLDPQGGGPILTQGFQQPSYTITKVEDALSEQYSIAIYPNPVSDRIIIRLGNVLRDYKNVQISLIDVTGKILANREIQSHETEINLSMARHAPGTYFIRISTSEGKLLESFQVQKVIK